MSQIKKNSGPDSHSGPCRSASATLSCCLFAGESLCPDGQIRDM